MASSNAVLGQMTRVSLGQGRLWLGHLTQARAKVGSCGRERKVAAPSNISGPAARPAREKAAWAVVASKRILPGDRVALHLIDQPLTAQA